MNAVLILIGMIFAPFYDRLGSRDYFERKEATETLIDWCLLAGPYLDFRFKTEANPEVQMRVDLINLHRQKNSNGLYNIFLIVSDDKSLDEKQLRFWSNRERWKLVKFHYESKYEVIFSDNLDPLHDLYREFTDDDLYYVLKQTRQLIGLGQIHEKVKK